MSKPVPLSHGEAASRLTDFMLNALPANVAAGVDAHIAECEACTREVESAAVIHRLAAANAAPPPSDLRGRVLSAAFEHRPPIQPASAPTFAAWEAEIGRFRELLDEPLLNRGRGANVATSPWDLMCIAAFDLSIRDVVSHLVASESLWAERLGNASIVPETEQNLEARTRAAIRRHRSGPVQAAIDEFDAVAEAVRRRLVQLGEPGGAADSGMIPGFSVESYTALNALEVWTHADDIRDALGLDDLAPESLHVATMTTVLPQWIALMVRAVDRAALTRHYRVKLTGKIDSQLDLFAAGAEPLVTITCDAVEFCKLAAARRNHDSFEYQAAGDTPSARSLVEAMADFSLI